MKFKITLKDPDGVYDAIRAAVQESLPEELTLNEQEAVGEVRENEVKESLSRWFLYDEYLTVEVDTDNKTITVLEQT